MKRIFVMLCLATGASLMLQSAYCAEKGAVQTKTAVQTPAARPNRPMPPAMDRNIKFLNGTISAINTADPQNIKIDVKNESDEKVSTVEVAAQTNVLKVVEPSELKAGEKVRVMTRTVNDKNVAISIMTGNIKMPPMRKPVSVQAPVNTTPVKK